MATQRSCQNLRTLDTEVDPTGLDAGNGGLRNATDGRELRLAKACSSRMIRTDSPGLTSMRFFSEMNLGISMPPLVMRSNAGYLDSHEFGLHGVDNAPLLVQPG
jgi:hypothetical protein